MPLYLKNGKTIFYVHVPKTGGTAIERFFVANQFRVEYFDNGGGQGVNMVRRCSPQHMHAEQITTLLRTGRIDYFFMTVRDPVRRMVSEYKMRLQANPALPSISKWFDKVCKLYTEDRYISDNHMRPQSEFWLPNCEVFRQEDGFGAAMVSRIEDVVGTPLEHRQIDHRNTTRKVADPSPLEVEDLLPRVHQFYRSDYQMFGY